jgi:hypothetical protein
MYFFRKKNNMDYIEYYKSLPSALIYSNDAEYRKILRKVFQFDPTVRYSYDGKAKPLESLDSISQDELLFDEDKISDAMDKIYRATSTCFRFQDLYKNAAATMISTSPEIGHAVLCSYDNFNKFHTCVWHYLNGGEYSLCSCLQFNELVAKFSTK